MIGRGDPFYLKFLVKVTPLDFPSYSAKRFNVICDPDKLGVLFKYRYSAQWLTYFLVRPLCNWSGRSRQLAAHKKTHKTL